MHSAHQGFLSKLSSTLSDKSLLLWFVDLQPDLSFASVADDFAADVVDNDPLMQMPALPAARRSGSPWMRIGAR